jgi:hypothetical protein
MQSLIFCRNISRRKPCYLPKYILAKMEGESAPLPPPQHREQLSGVAVVIIIAVGVQTFIMLFIFAKRQIMRFTLRGRRGPHVSVGQGGYRYLNAHIMVWRDVNTLRARLLLCISG